jgi:phosphoglycerol transferase MdoB-like AlkP superfamily enzyme
MNAKVPKLIKFLLSLFIFELILFTLLRVVFFILFAQYDLEHSFANVLYSFWIGFRFDAQLFAIAFLPILLLGGVKYIGLYKSTFAKYFWLSYIFLANTFFMLLYVVNIAYYDFFKHLLDSSIIRYLYDLGEAMKMLSEGYPLVSTSIGSMLFLIILFMGIKKLYERYETILDFNYSRRAKISIYVVFFIIYVFSGYGKFEFYPWRWSEAFYTSNKFLSSLASNPVTYFVNTLKNKDVKYDLNATKATYPTIVEFLEVNQPNSDSLSIARLINPKESSIYNFKSPNVVFILGESSSYARSSMSGNPLNPTPFLQSMSDEGLTYSRYYTPHSGTARSVWAALTGLTDVERMKTSSRNPMTVSQYMPLNMIENYEKFYFIGGSLSWGNIRGVISNIEGIHKYEESDYKNSPNNDVWGISDVHLANEVNNVLKKQTKPFFAFVQLSGNHSPNTIPDENFAFSIIKDGDKSEYLKYAFDGKENEFNGQRFLDHSVKRLISLAKKESYFDNTIFIFVGDHGLPRRADHMTKGELLYETHTVHTPLIIYAPKLIKHKKIDYPVGEVDIMTTIVGLMGEPYINASMGRNLLSKEFDEKEHYAFYMTHDVNPRINLIAKEYILRMRADGSNAHLLEYYTDTKPVDVSEEKKELFERMKRLTKAIYEQTRYTRYHNSQEDVEEQARSIK